MTFGSYKDNTPTSMNNDQKLATVVDSEYVGIYIDFELMESSC